MLVESITALMIASLAMGQTPLPATQMTPPATQSSPAQNVPAGQVVPTPASETIIVPAGTAIQLTLMSAVKSKSTKAGDTVRAVVAFPVTIGTRLAIPAGTFVDGSVTSVTAHPKAGQRTSFRVHFTRLVFSNGYSVPLDGENTQALLVPPETGAPANEVAELTPMQLPGMHFAMGEGQEPTQPSLPRVGPNPAVVGGAVGGGMLALIIGMIVYAHHRANNTDFVLYDAGWQFQMILDSPVALNAAQVAASAAIPSAN
jgi:type IV secretion system protein VirB10